MVKSKQPKREHQVASEKKQAQTQTLESQLLMAAQEIFTASAQANANASAAAAARDALAAARDAAALSQPALMERCFILASSVLPPLPVREETPGPESGMVPRELE